MVKTGISTASFFDKLMLEDAPELFHRWGVVHAEYYLNSWSEYAQDFVKLLKKRSDDAGIRVVAVHPMSLQFEPLLFTPHPRQREDAEKGYAAVLRAGEMLGADHYVMHGPVVLNGVAKNLQLERLAPIFDRLSDMAEDHGLHLTLENVSYSIMPTPEIGQRIHELMTRPLYHTLDIKQSLRAGVDPLAFVDALGEHIIAVHACDCDRSGNTARYCLPPHGDVDFRGIVSALQKKGFSGAVLLEAYSDMFDTNEELRDAFYALDRQINSQEEEH
ncbi:MAG: sugar phosphate isomerase/epimerase [Clostridia bacterium]|nr:sugar phosphate isomerase/epimerase [Clostridia bacterium]